MRKFCAETFRKKTLRIPIRGKEENPQMDLNEVVSYDGVTCNWPGIVSSGGTGTSGVEPLSFAARGCMEKKWIELAQDCVQRWLLHWRC
jgi:hypothetical protein